MIFPGRFLISRVFSSITEAHFSNIKKEKITNQIASLSFSGNLPCIINQSKKSVTRNTV